MPSPVVTVASGGLAVVDVTATKPTLGLPVTEAANGKGVAVTKVATYGLPVTYWAAMQADVTAPNVTCSNVILYTENTPLAFALTANEPVTWTIQPGMDAVKFEIFGGSTLRWAGNVTKDYEAPDDFDANRTYIVTVRATDAVGNYTNWQINLALLNVLEIAAWTDFVATEPSGEGTGFVGAGTRKIYISQSTGLDANLGTLASPKKTLSAGKAAMRAGSPDWLLLKNGDTWTDEAFDYFNNRSGVSAAAPALIGPWTFGGVRPIVKMNPSVNQGGFGLLGTSNFWVLYGIEFYAYTRDPSNPSYNAATLATQLHGLDCTSSGTWLWVEDCKFSFSTGTTIQLVGATVTLFRNVFADNYWSAGHSNNFFDGVANLTNKENVYAHNGWNATAGVPRDVFCHGWYFQYTAGNAGTHVGNVVAQAGANGAQCRPGGTITNNLFAGNPIGLLTGGGESTNGTQGGDVSSNVIVEGIDPSGWGIDVHACNATVRVFNNIIANDSASPAQDPNTVAIQLQTGTTADEATNNIIYHWGINAIVNSGTGNIVTGNVIDGTSYGAPTRTLSTYDSAVLGGPGTIDHFLTLARAQSRNSYNTALTADGVNTWIRAGFGL